MKRSASPGGVAAQQYGPEQLGTRRYYEPTRHGAEARYADVYERLRVALGRDAAPEPDPAPPVGSDPAASTAPSTTDDSTREGRP